jgi:hypothetical protein
MKRHQSKSGGAFLLKEMNRIIKLISRKAVARFCNKKYFILL